MNSLASLKSNKNIMIGIYALMGTLLILIALFILAAIFPNQFERLGLGIFLNRKSGVFAECGTNKSHGLPACSNQNARDREHQILTAPPKTDSIRQEKMIPFTFH